jgi:ribosomal protein L7/L12
MNVPNLLRELADLHEENERLRQGTARSAPTDLCFAREIVRILGRCAPGQDNHVKAIRLYRLVTGVNLLEAKAAIEVRYVPGSTELVDEAPWGSPCNG